MPLLLLLLLLIILIAQIGFWDTLAAILGGILMLVLLVLIAVAIVGLAGWLVIRKLRG